MYISGTSLFSQLLIIIMQSDDDSYTIRKLSLEHLSSFRSTGVQEYDSKVSTIYNSFNQCHYIQMVYCPVISQKRCRWTKFSLTIVRSYASTTEGSEMVLALD